MKKLFFVLTALLLAVPALGTISINCAQVGDTNEVAVSYVATDGNLPRGFGLDISVDMGQTINVISYEDPNFWVHPGNIVITSGDVTDEGSPVAPGSDPCTAGQLGSGAITIEMGSLYHTEDSNHPNQPPTTDVLLKFKVSGDCNVTITGNGARGNVVLENTEAASTNLPSACQVTIVPPDCFPIGHADYAKWVARGKPSCWCEVRQCKGDADGIKEGGSKTGYWYVGSGDLSILSAGWKIPEPPKGSGILGLSSSGVFLTCADFDHGKEGGSKTGYWYLGSADLSIMAGNWKIPEPPKGSGVPATCP